MNFEKSWFLQDTNMWISAIIRIYMLSANFYRDSPMLGFKWFVLELPSNFLLAEFDHKAIARGTSLAFCLIRRETLKLSATHAERCELKQIKLKSLSNFYGFLKKKIISFTTVWYHTGFLPHLTRSEHRNDFFQPK